jgi:hypothetical protein
MRGYLYLSESSYLAHLVALAAGWPETISGNPVQKLPISQGIPDCTGPIEPVFSAIPNEPELIQCLPL